MKKGFYYCTLFMNQTSSVRSILLESIKKTNSHKGISREKLDRNRFKLSISIFERYANCCRSFRFNQYFSYQLCNVRKSFRIKISLHLHFQVVWKIKVNGSCVNFHLEWMLLNILRFTWKWEIKFRETIAKCIALHRITPQRIIWLCILYELWEKWIWIGCFDRK